MVTRTAHARAWARIALLALSALALGLLPFDTHVRTAIQEGDGWTAQQRYSAALDAYARAATRCPGCPAPRLRQADVYLRQGRIEDAWAAALDAIRLGGLCAPAQETIARLYAADGAPALAAQVTERLLRGASERADLWLLLAEARQALGAPDAARAAYARALEVETDDARAQRTHDRLGMLCVAQEAPCALEHLSAAARGPDEALADEAAQIVEALTALAEGDQPALGQAKLGGALLRRGELTLARRHLQRAVDLAPDYVDGHAYLGHVLSVLGEHGLALEHLLRAIALEPDYPLSSYFLGMHYLRAGPVVAGRATLEHAHDLDPADPAICAAVADAYLRDDPVNYALAERWLHAAVDRAPDDARFHLLLAHFYVDANVDPGVRGVAVAQVAVELAPRSAEALETLGWAYHLGGQSGAAVEPLLRARALAPEHARLHYRLGEVYRALGQVDLARGAYQQALDLDWNGTFGDRARRALEQL
ncbi:MAG: tetratricopeptide repeat protein [Anaerolineae bacterium]|nr:tetratricopeptide repeat protein [Anaerolineae bacterium]